MHTERVTLTMPREIVKQIDGMTKNRSRFIVDAVRRELARQRREELRLSLRNPHEESEQVAELGVADWGAALPDDSDLLTPGSGRAVRWRAEKGWSSAEEPDSPEPIGREGSRELRATGVGPRRPEGNDTPRHEPNEGNEG